MGVGAEGSNVPPAPPHFTSALTPPTLPPSTQPPIPPTQPKLPTLPCLPCSQPAAAVSGPPADRAAPVPLPSSRLPNMGEQSRLLLGRHWSESQGSFSLVMTEGKVKYTQLCLREFHGKKTVFSLYAELQRVIHYCLSSVFWDQPSYGMCFINWHSSQGKHSHTHGRTQEHIPHSHVWFVYTLTPSHTAVRSRLQLIAPPRTFCAVRSAPVRDNNFLHSPRNGGRRKNKGRNVYSGNLVIRRTYKPQEDMIEFPLFPLCFCSHGTLPI